MEQFRVLVPLLSFLALTTACKKDTVAPTTGDLKVNFINAGATSYSLYTEVGWAGPNFVQPLRQGTIDKSITSPTPTGYKGTAIITSLNAGNYVITTGAQGIPVQVVAGTTTEAAVNL